MKRTCCFDPGPSWVHLVHVVYLRCSFMRVTTTFLNGTVNEFVEITEFSKSEKSIVYELVN